MGRKIDCRSCHCRSWQRERERQLGLRVTSVREFDAFGQKPLAPPLPPPRERGPASFGGHAGAKSMLAFARSFRGLVSAFHKVGNREKEGSAYGRRLKPLVNQAWEQHRNCQCASFLE
jgi:hypothetical protein